MTQSADSGKPLFFQFTLGPVQGFVAQARRTRDFWAGSFLLSWLAGVAIAAIQAQKGSIIFPTPDENYMDFLKGKKESGDSPQQGSIPNRFMAATAQVPVEFHPEWITEAVQNAWQALADKIWENDLAHVAGEKTKTIWQRQIAGFWEMSWVISEDKKNAGNLLDRRKNWRSHALPDEPGHKCMMMDGWQELSGVEETDLKLVRQFWQNVIANGDNGMETDLRAGEQLCAMAFIKRRFARYFEQVECHLPHVQGKARGWRVPAAVPSVSFMAAAPWLARLIEKADLKDFKAFCHAAGELTGDKFSEFPIDICCVREAAQNRPGFERRWAGLDGAIYFPALLENPRTFSPENADAQNDDGQTRRLIENVQKHLRNLTSPAKLDEAPSPFYAILLMDGDRLGMQMRHEEKQKGISQALNAFTKAAAQVVKEENGFLVYAGGDDVLALFPLEYALPAAARLQKVYVDALKRGGVESTLSGAIEYAHIKTPLTRVLKDAHELLDDVAKEETGRNAIAVRVWKPSGLALEWAMPWPRALDDDGRARMVDLAQDFAQEEKTHPGFSNKFFFRMKKVLEGFPNAPAATLEKLIWSEYVHSRDGLPKNADEKHVNDLHARLNALLAQCRIDDKENTPIRADGALLVRFLAQKGLEQA